MLTVYSRVGWLFSVNNSCLICRIRSFSVETEIENSKKNNGIEASPMAQHFLGKGKLFTGNSVPQITAKGLVSKGGNYEQ